MSSARGRDLAILTVGQAVTTVGDAAAMVALLLRMRPDGTGWVAALLAGELVPYVLLGTVAGLAVDRFETRRVLLFALTGQAVVAVPLAMIVTPWITVVLFVALNALSALAQPATSSLVPAITGPAGATGGYARLATGTSLGWLIGPAVGGIVTGAFGATSALLMDAATFAVLAGATALLRARRPPSKAGPPLDRPKRGGFALLWNTPALRVALLISAIATGCAVIDNVAAPFRLIDQLGTDDTGYGLYLTVWGAGALLGVLLLSRLEERRLESTLALGNLLMGLGIAGIGIAPTFVVALGASAVGGLGNGLVNVTRSALIAAHITQAEHGRAFAAAGAGTQLAIGIGTAIAAPLVVVLHPNLAMVAAGTCAMAAATGGLAYALRPCRITTGAIAGYRVPSRDVLIQDHRHQSSAKRSAAIRSSRAEASSASRRAGPAAASAACRSVSPSPDRPTIA